MIEICARRCARVRGRERGRAARRGAIGLRAGKPWARHAVDAVGWTDGGVGPLVMIGQHVLILYCARDSSRSRLTYGDRVFAWDI